MAVIEQGGTSMKRVLVIAAVAGSAALALSATAGAADDPQPVPTIVSGPGATNAGYATPVMATQVGGPLQYTNLDVVQHDVVSEKKRRGRPLFSTPLTSLGETEAVKGLKRVKSGQTYGFYCSIHPGMRGQLVVG
jgi:plastocyanin